MNFLKKLSIRSQLFLLAISALLIAAATMMLYYRQVVHVIMDKNNQYVAYTFKQVEQSVSANCDVLGRVLTNIAYNPVVQDYMMEKDEWEKYRYSQNVEKLISKAMAMKEGIIDIAVVSQNDNNFNLNGGIHFLSSNCITFPERTKAYYSGMKTFENLTAQTHEDCFAVGTTVFSINPKQMMGEKIGKAALIVKADTVVPDMRDIRQIAGTSFYFLDREGIIFASDNQQDVGKKFTWVDDLDRYLHKPGEIMIGSHTFWIQVGHLEDIGGKIVGLTPKNDLLADVVQIRSKILIILVIALLLLSLLFLVIINNVLSPISKFKNFIAAIKSSDLKGLKERVTVEGYAEMCMMAEEFNSMLDEIDRLTNQLIEANARLYKAEILKRQSELYMLQSQINPHFLYNTLETVKGMALAIDAGHIVEMTKALSRIFKYAIQGVDFVTLHDELKILKAYIHIQQIRFVGRFEVFYDIEERALNCIIPKMILQPIVENAVHHGLEMMRSGGRITIRVFLESDNQLTAVFTDNGAGIKREVLEKIHRDLEFLDESRFLESSKSNRIGLQNVNYRIKLIYGDEYGVFVDGDEGKGTQVVVKLGAVGNEHV